MELNNSNDELQAIIRTLSEENITLRRRIALYEEAYEEVREAKELSQEFFKQKVSTLFQRYFLDTDDIIELQRCEETICKALSNQVAISRQMKKKFAIYDAFTRLHFMHEKLSSAESKILLLLQMTGSDDATILLRKLFEERIHAISSAGILSEYYALVKELAAIVKDKDSFWNEFSLTIVPDDIPKTEKEKRKQEIRDNTIRNLYRKHGEKLFLPKNMLVLWSSLAKVGIKTENLSESKIRQICKRM